MALNALVMKVNNLIERKNKREAIRAGKADPRQQMDESSHTRFTVNSRRSARSHRQDKKKRDKNVTLLPDVPDETDEDLGFDEKEKLERSKLKEIDSMYLLNSDKEDDEYNIFRGVRKPNQKANNESFAPLVSPYIHMGQNSATKSESSPTNSRDSSTVMDVTQNNDRDDGDDVNDRVRIDENLYEELDNLDNEQAQPNNRR